MDFERYSLFQGRTLAWRLFKRYHTHFNDIYWSHRVAHQHAYASTRSYQRDNKVSELFEYREGSRSRTASLGRWADHYDDFDRWSRMAAVIAVSGYLETFLAQIGTAALESSPTRVFGDGPAIDGAIYLKHSSGYNLYSHSEGLVRGDWQSRKSAFKRLFERCPFEAHLASLERLRKLRNDTGHTFGRDIRDMSFAASWKVAKIPMVTDAQLKNILRVIDSVAVSTEALLGPIVGKYEIIKIYHGWVDQRPGAGFEPRRSAKEFSRLMHDKTGLRYGIQPSLRLFEYYDNL